MRLQRGKVRGRGSVSPARSIKSEENFSSAAAASSLLPDLSLLRKSIATSVTSFTHARSVYDTGTNELKQLLSSECDIIYECRVCRNLFRSLANFISHKRVYCCDKFNSSLHPHFSNNNCMKDDLITILKNEEEYQEYVRNKNKPVDRSKGNKFQRDTTARKNAASKDLTSIIENLLNRSNNVSSSMVDKRYTKIQQIPDTNNVVYQNVVTNQATSHEAIKDQVAELDRMISSNEAVLAPDGKFITCSDSAAAPIDGVEVKELKNDLYCEICKIKFSTLKTKKFHMKHKHSDNRLVFPCTECPDTFSNTWSVLRHLVKVHRKTPTHIRKLRDTIQNKAYRMSVSHNHIEEPNSTENANDPISEQERMDQENQAWIENLEGDGDIPRCGGCGKRFERRAALSAHRQTCQLRKSAQNKMTARKVATKVGGEAQQPTEAAVKVSKYDKHSEKRIEIKIRKNYNKIGMTRSTSESSPLPDEEDEGEEDITEQSNDVGENECDNNDSDSAAAVKDCDDANVDNVVVEDGDIDFEDIKRVCNEGDDNAAAEADSQDAHFECTYCWARFTVKTKLERHISRHMLWIKYECQVCGVKSCNETQYAKHMKMQHDEPIESDKSNSISTARECKPSTALEGKVIKAKRRYRQSAKTLRHAATKGKRSVGKTLKNFEKSISPIQDIPLTIKTEPVDEADVSIASSKEETSEPNATSMTTTTTTMDAPSVKKTRLKRKRNSQHVASSESYTVQRPVRNRVKNIDKDFEYDSSYLPKVKSEITQMETNHLKRKPFLQTSPEETKCPITITTTTTEGMPHKLYSGATPETSPSKATDGVEAPAKSHEGRLRALSLKAVSQGRAHMKMEQAAMMRRNPPFVRTSVHAFKTAFPPVKTSFPSTPRVYQKAKRSPQCGTDAVATTTTHPQTMKVSPTSAITTITASTTSKRSSSGSGSPTFHHRPNKGEKSLLLNSGGVQKRKSAVHHHDHHHHHHLKIDQQMLKKARCSGEITMISKLQQSTHASRPNDIVSDTPLSILPSNDKSSSFVNISLKELKKLQRGNNLLLDSGRLVPAQCSPHDEVQISKVDAIRRSMARTFAEKATEPIVVLQVLTDLDKSPQGKPPDVVASELNTSEETSSLVADESLSQIAEKLADTIGKLSVEAEGLVQSV